jgi:hypothetical protein
VNLSKNRRIHKIQKGVVLMNNKKFSTKKLFTSTLLILMIAFSTISATLTLADAHSPAWEIPTYLYITTAPSPVGVVSKSLLYSGLTGCHLQPQAVLVTDGSTT